ncbi:DKNYY domain-containing protein [Sphingobacterium spiritivorum]|uniref:DKNYY domain-containing protein n=1 Tax=Sphingobacterium spiritivorum TaxID=258 RepID=UPI00191811BA|nr:DKNYY domain-containing protein [Sphingobacterium spiritivorum]QQT25914.1 DKNYY domain-containing protein [Sphingobacterium spiritivorum]
MFRKILYTLISCSQLGMLFSCAEQVDAISENYYLKSGKIYYIPGGNSFERGSVETGADKITFKVLSADVAKDKTHIYYKGYAQRQVDYSSFYLEDGLFKDKDHVYYSKNYSFEPGRPSNPEDRNQWSIVRLADPKTFTKLAAPNQQWAKDKNRYFYNYEPLEVDYSTYRIINKSFSTDKNTLYINENRLVKATKYVPAVIDSLTEHYILLNHNTLLYYVSQLVEQPIQNSKDIRVLHNNVLCIDSKVVVDGNLFHPNEADASSFEILFISSSFFVAKDKNKVYYQEEIINGADAATYQNLYLAIGKDKDHVYSGATIVNVPDPSSFRRMKGKDFDFRDDKGNQFKYVRKENKVRLQDQSGKLY